VRKYDFKKEDKVVDASNHSDWLTFFRHSINNYDYPRVINYINMRLVHLHFYFRKNIFNHRNINCFSFFNNSSIFFMINIYSDEHQTALKYLKDTEANFHNILVMVENFNIRNSNCYQFLSNRYQSITLITLIMQTWSLIDFFFV